MSCMLQKAFVVPAVGNQTRIPFARVNHNKYMVTDHVAYIGMYPICSCQNVEAIFRPEKLIFFSYSNFLSDAVVSTLIIPAINKVKWNIHVSIQ